MSEVSLPVQGIQLIVSVALITFELSRKKRILENLDQQESPDIIVYNPVSALGTTT